MQIVIRRQDQDYGPYPVSLVHQHLASGYLKPSDLARLEGKPAGVHHSLKALLKQLPASQGATAGAKTPPPARPKFLPAAATVSVFVRCCQRSVRRAGKTGFAVIRGGAARR